MQQSTTSSSRGVPLWPVGVPLKGYQHACRGGPRRHHRPRDAAPAAISIPVVTPTITTAVADQTPEPSAMLAMVWEFFLQQKATAAAAASIPAATPTPPPVRRAPSPERRRKEVPARHARLRLLSPLSWPPSLLRRPLPQLATLPRMTMGRARFLSSLYSRDVFPCPLPFPT